MSNAELIRLYSTNYCVKSESNWSEGAACDGTLLNTRTTMRPSAKTRRMPRFTTNGASLIKYRVKKLRL